MSGLILEIGSVVLGLAVLNARHRHESGADWRRFGRLDLFFLGPLLILTLALAAALGRPLTALTLSAALTLVLALLNRAKARVLKEPLVFADIYMLRQLIFFPRFYFPYIPARPFILLLFAVFVLSAGLLALDRRLPDFPAEVRVSLGAAALALALLGLADILGPGAGERWNRRLRRHPLSFSPWLDGAAYGLAGAAVLGAVVTRHGRRALLTEAGPEADGLGPACLWPRELRRPLPAARRPHLVLVQAESYFLARRLLPELGSDWTANFDRLAWEGCSGLLGVTNYGAYTVRTEHAILTGLGRETLGGYAYNPYALAAAHDLGSLPRWLAVQGYRTMCLHPGSPKFLDRHLALPRLGFERFLHEGDFSGAPRFGPYIADPALGDRVARELLESDGPLCLLAITIEAHGPWEHGRLRGQPWPEDASPLPPRPGLKDPDSRITAYLRHLRRADQLLGALAGLAGRLDRPLVLGWYGDHLGSLPSDIRPAPGASRATDFLIWDSRRGCAPRRLRAPVPPELFGALVLAELHQRDSSPWN